MILFMFKKAFWDAWDNMGRMLLINFVMILLVAIPVFLPKALVDIPALSLAMLILSILLIFVYVGAVSAYVRDIVQYKSPDLKDILTHLKDNWKKSLILGAASIFFYFICFTGFQFYSALGSTMGLIGLAFLFWIFVIVSITLVFFFPVMNNLDKDLRKIVKKSFILFFDNTGVAVALAIGMLFNAGVSLALAFILPGIGGILILQESAMKLILMKYDYLEETPDADRKKIPWGALLREEREKVGVRTLKGTIFPWKD
ncbi:MULTISPECIES: hypothetical protein [unclassified Oceanispirochaeta]|uniref:hypothetical protein n=1 Tax=unclassified Oceanispirochaeta TaxID=2635722 RepID=UPI000E096B7A|nr:MULTISPECIES: hypothetical protein [unclassified Oceanispirochaeta]MBF9016066.1 hypothetical protein [Oceanispirochaeta sp. M2]NPD72529.1 hypothetical protein [Oceanispirochaeta sp. M1]RDG31986.1 hypothetical protein DV872_10490 [Oceanispirochaeta sp. M1]